MMVKWVCDNIPFSPSYTYEHFTIINEHFTIISLKYTIICSLDHHREAAPTVMSTKCKGRTRINAAFADKQTQSSRMARFKYSEFYEIFTDMYYDARPLRFFFLRLFYILINNKLIYNFAIKFKFACFRKFCFFYYVVKLKEKHVFFFRGQGVNLPPPTPHPWSEHSISLMTLLRYYWRFY